MIGRGDRVRFEKTRKGVEDKSFMKGLRFIFGYSLAQTGLAMTLLGVGGIPGPVVSGLLADRSADKKARKHLEANIVVFFR